MDKRPLTDKDRAFLARHRALAKEDERPVRGSAEMIEISGELRRESSDAILWFDGSREGWVPKSQVKAMSDGAIYIPMWCAKNKGFI